MRLSVQLYDNYAIVLLSELNRLVVFVMAVIECTDLTKLYGQFTALKELNLAIEQGTSFGLLGENGAGKSTLVRLLMGFIFPTSGQLHVLGEAQVMRAHTRVGYVPERPFFERRVSGRGYLLHFGRLLGLRDPVLHQHVDELLERVHLRDAAARTVGGYSKGMQQRLAIAQALLTDPDLLILDEPTSGLDPRSQWEIRQLIQGLRSQGKTVLLCSHYLAEVQELCDSICILRRGEMILSGTVAELVTAHNAVEIVLAAHLQAWSLVDSLGLPEQSILSAQENRLVIQGEAQAQVLELLVQAQIPLISLQPQQKTLEEVYVRVTDRANREVAATFLQSTMIGDK